MASKGNHAIICYQLLILMNEIQMKLFISLKGFHIQLENKVESLLGVKLSNNCLNILAYTLTHKQSSKNYGYENMVT